MMMNGKNNERNGHGVLLLSPLLASTAGDDVFASFSKLSAKKKRMMVILFGALIAWTNLVLVNLKPKQQQQAATIMIGGAAVAAANDEEAGGSAAAVSSSSTTTNNHRALNPASTLSTNLSTTTSTSSSALSATTASSSSTPGDEKEKKEETASQGNKKQPQLQLQEQVCYQNPYRVEFKDSLEIIAGRAQAWLDDLPSHHNKSMQPHMFQRKTRHRFFVFDSMAPCNNITCVGGACINDESKQTCGLGQLEKQATAAATTTSKTTTTTSAAAAQAVATTSTNEPPGVSPSPPPCVIYSIGGNNQWGFETSMGKLTPSCEIHTFDCTGPLARFYAKPNASVVPNLHFHHVCIGTQHEAAAPPEKCTGQNKCGETWTLKEIQQKLGHKRIDLFKMDVEGFEWPIFESWPELTDEGADEVILPMQILVEVHYVTQFRVLCPQGRENMFNCGGPFKDPPDFVRLAAHLMRAGYTVSVRDDNPWCKHCTELTLVRTSCPRTGAYQNLLQELPPQ